jgi:predicted DsbA family dithiol-disulfide isomerase
VHQLIESDPHVELIWRAYELRPEPVPMIDPNSDYLRRVWSDSVAPLAARLGVTMRFPPVKPRTRLAHEAAHWARAQGRFDDFHNEVFRAFFERGEDIGDVEVLIALGRKLELDSNSLRQALTTH